MPAVLSKLPCGIIYTSAFEKYLAAISAEQANDYPQQMLTLEYIRCASGSLKGKAWWQITWVPLKTVPEYRQHRIGSIMVHIPKSTQHGLRERCLDYREGKVIVIP